jgi:hypothetical protein
MSTKRGSNARSVPCDVGRSTEEPGKTGRVTRASGEVSSSAMILCFCCRRCHRGDLEKWERTAFCCGRCPEALCLYDSVTESPIFSFSKSLLTIGASNSLVHVIWLI